MEQEFTPSELPGRIDGLVYIYGLVDPRTEQLRYVGKTVDMYERYRDHKRVRKNCYLRNWFRQVVACDLLPEMFLIETVAEADWPAAERFWINYFEYIGANLCNRHAGGWGGNYKPFSEEHRANLSKALRGRKQPPMTAEHRKKLGDANRGRKQTWTPWNLGKKVGPCPEERKKKIGDANRGKKHPNKKMPLLTEEHKARISTTLKGRTSPTKGMKLGPWSNERKAAFSAAVKGKKKPPFTDEHRRKLSESKKGLKYPPRTEEARRNYSEAAKRRCARQRAEREKRDGHTDD